MTLLSFGDVVTYDGQRYVFLAATHRFVYLARIFNADNPFTTQVQRLYQTKGKHGEASRNPVYCYVILTTEEMTGHMAHLYNNQHDAISTFDSIATKIQTLNDKDKQELKRAILEDNAPTSLELRKIIEP